MSDELPVPTHGDNLSQTSHSSSGAIDGECQMTLTARHRTRRLMSCVLLATALLVLPRLVEAETVLKPIPTQYIAALGDAGATSGVGAESWGLWREDPGPRGVRLSSYAALKADGVAPEQWKFDGSDW